MSSLPTGPQTGYRRGWGGIGTATLTVLLIALGAGCRGRDTDSGPSEVAPLSTTTPAEIFVDVTDAVGLDFVHFNGMTGEYYFCEMMGAGVALVDYDNDDDLDLYLVQGHLLGNGISLEDALVPPRHPLPLTDRLYRNDLAVGADGTRTVRFTDVTEESGLRATGYGMGVATGDFDNDGWVDLYVTNFESNQMLRNNGDGTFADVTEVSGSDDRRWSVPATFFDFDSDGWLDLYVGNYVDFALATHKQCPSDLGVPNYCGPHSYKPLPDSLFRNRGDGSFEDVTGRAGLQSAYGGALGAVSADFNGDGRLDLYIANDGVPNQLWMNQGDGTFRNEALLAGCAVNGEGTPEASMGVAAADFDGDTDEDLFMAHLNGETNTVFVNDGAGLFEDRSIETGLALPSVEFTGFGALWFDYDNDGWLDVLTANGAVRTIPALALAGDAFPLHQRNQLFHNRGQGRFVEILAAAGSPFAVSEVSRGAAFGDIDNDGDVDVVISNNNGPARVLLNHVGQDRHWLGLRLVGGEVHRDVLGTRVAVFADGHPPLWRRVRTGGSYASANDPRLLVGLGSSAAVSHVRAVWPDGRVEEWRDLPTDRYNELKQGSGRTVEPPRP